jgi:acyl carrier protein phosphodiesterase
MNFLAHSLLAFGDDEVMVGQFAGDFVRGRDLSAHSPAVAMGIRLHRHVDAFTDRTAGMATLRARFPSALRRFSGIAIDVAADFHLAARWSEHTAGLTEASLAEHARQVDRVLARYRVDLAPGLNRLADAMRDQRLLERWATRDGVEQTLQRLSRRSPAMAPLAQCVDQLWALDDEVAEFVALLWPALVGSTQARYQLLESSQ